MENETSYDQRGYYRIELGENYGEAYVSYSDGALNVVLPKSLNIGPANGLTINISGSQVTLAESVTISVSSGYTVNGTLVVNGNAKITGDCLISGNLSVGKDIMAGGRVVADGDVTGRGKSLAEHIHYGHGGEPTTKPV